MLSPRCQTSHNIGMDWSNKRENRVNQACRSAHVRKSWYKMVERCACMSGLSISFNYLSRSLEDPNQNLLVCISDLKYLIRTISLYISSKMPHAFHIVEQKVFPYSSFSLQERRVETSIHVPTMHQRPNDTFSPPKRQPISPYKIIYGCPGQTASAILRTSSNFFLISS